ncbi:MAG: glycoside hydrolase family 16 protein [Planctomycetota bacterium]
MRTLIDSVWLAIGILLAALGGPVRAEEAQNKPLIDFSAPGAEARIASQEGNSGAEFKIADGAKGKVLEITIKAGPAGYPGVSIKPEGTAWDLSAFGHVEARVVNTGAKAVGVNIRVDNPGDWHDNPWNCEQLWLDPGASGTLSVIFGYSYGRKPGFALKPAAINNILIFTGKAKEQESFRIESLVAAGPAGEKPPVDPNSVRVKPKDGVILGPGVAIDPATQLEAKGTQATLNAAAAGGQALRIVFPAEKGEHSVALKPAIGRWDLRDAFEIHIKVKNDGQTPLTPHVQATSDSGPTDLIAPVAALAPGAEQELVIPFAPAATWKGIPNSGDRTSWDGVKGTGTKFAHDACAAVRISAGHDGEAALLVQSIRTALPAAELPEWLGKRPPVEGDWVKTFDDEFDGAEIDQTKWAIYGPNYWDKTSHWSKEDLIVGGGVVKMRYEKKTGHHNDDPKEKESRYAAGFLETYGKWVQRYGYFEARMKLPAAPGLWPAFWMVPDRGVAAGPQWKRSNTGNGGMEFDIMEHLTRWGPCRYNIAMHWDGYEKAHKTTGTGFVYVQPDKDGFITSGLLWTPGSAVYYCQGKEVARWEDPRIASVPEDMMLTLPTGGWDNNSLDDAQLPADFTIDYVRVWQRKDLASEVDGYAKVPAEEKKN